MEPRVNVLRTSMSSVSRRISPGLAFFSIMILGKYATDSGRRQGGACAGIGQSAGTQERLRYEAAARRAFTAAPTMARSWLLEMISNKLPCSGVILTIS